MKLPRAQPTPTGSDRDAVARLTEPSPVLSTQGAIHDTAGVYRQKLDEAYRALDDAYAQIRALQSPQPQLASAAVTMTRSGRTMAMTIVVGADLTDAVHRTTNEREAATPCGDHVRWILVGHLRKAGQ